MYSNCGLIDDATRVFFSSGYRNVYSYNIIISGLAHSGRVIQAEVLFDEMPERDSVSWNSMMSGYFWNGKYDDVIKVFVSLVRECSCVPSLYSFSCVMKACGCLGYGKLATQLHAFAKKFNFGSDFSIEKSSLDMYVKCDGIYYAERLFFRMKNPSLFCWNSMIYGYSKVLGAERALDMFKRMAEHDVVSWNIIISILSKHGFGVETLCMFIEMCRQGFGSNSLTYVSVLSACTNICDLEWGAHLHARLIRLESFLDVIVGNGLINMYAKCGHLKFARRVFNSLTERDSVSWTSIIYGAAHFGLGEEALQLFSQMRDALVNVDEFAIATVLGVCLSQNNLSIGEQLHAHTIKTGMESFVPVGNALVTMYAKCGGNIQKAYCEFEFMPRRNIISWTAMITAFSQNGDVEKARDCFNKMLERNLITWNSMITTYNQHGLWEEGLKLYNSMLREGVKPDWVTFSTSIGACANLSILKLGIQIVAHAEKVGFGSEVSVANSVLTMYSRCGQIKEAEQIFHSIGNKNLISWNAMMAGYAQNGKGKKVIEIFEDMLKMKCRPDHISFVALLSGCSHSGLVTEGKLYFNSMTKDFCMSPRHEHFACMVDLLGRSGLLEEAKSLIDGMPFKPTVDIWGALLGACQIHHNTNLAELVLRNLLELDFEVSGSYILLANTYSDSGKLEGVACLRKLMREKRMRKNPGCSWIEVDKRIHVFTADDINHPRIKDIYRVLEEIAEN